MNYIILISTLNTGMAYLDPGSGSLFLQLLFSSLAGVGFYFWTKLRKIKNNIQNNSTAIEEDDIDDDIFDE